MSEGMGFGENLVVSWAEEIEKVKRKYEHEAAGKHIAVAVIGDGALKIASRSKRMMHHFVKSVFITSHGSPADADRVIVVGKGILPEDCTCRGPHDEESAEKAFSAPDVVEKIEEAFKDVEIVLIVACLGGLTGSAGAKKVAEIAGAMGKFVMATVIYPFSVEGEERTARAAQYGMEIEKYCNKYIPLRNDDLRSKPERTLDTVMKIYGGAIDFILEQFTLAMDCRYFNKVVDDLSHEIREFSTESEEAFPHEITPEGSPSSESVVAKKGTPDEVEVDILKE